MKVWIVKICPPEAIDEIDSVWDNEDKAAERADRIIGHKVHKEADDWGTSGDELDDYQDEVERSVSWVEFELNQAGEV